jgi:hypothetical protein
MKMFNNIHNKKYYFLQQLFFVKSCWQNYQDMRIQKISLYPLMFLPRLQKFLFYLLELFIIFFLSNGIYKKELDFRIFLNFRLCYIYVFHLDLRFLCQYFFFS